MKSGRFSNPSKLFYGVALLYAGTLFPCAAIAQSQGYAPPPMFEEPVPPMVRPETKDGNIVQPRVSARPAEDQTKQPPAPKSPMMAPRVSVDADKPKYIPPVPPVKPKAPTSVSAATPAAKAIEKPVTPVVATPPVPVPVSPSVPATKAPSVPRDPKVSAITGPKTMPSVPVKDVEGQKTFEPAKTVQSAGDEPTMLERQQMQQTKPDTLVPVVPRPKDGVAPTAFEQGEQGALKKSYVYEPGQISLGGPETDALAVAVVNKLDAKENKDWRVQIKSFATAYGNGLSSDRRIALSRALSLRTSLISQGVPAARIDVLAQGQDTQDGKPGDRIDLYLYGPRHN